MSRADVARFITDALSCNEWDRKLVAIRTEKRQKEEGEKAPL
jgi:hypothetical protein